jgi:hypothetical protein
VPGTGVARRRWTGKRGEALEVREGSTPPPGVSLFTLSRRMGTSVDMIDRTYGHPAPDAEAVELALLNAYDVDLLEFELPKDRNSGGRSRPATSSAWPGRTA